MFATGHFDSVIHRIVRPDGEVRWMLTAGEIERDADGRPLRVMGGNLDITEKRQLEDQLRRAQQMEAVGRLTAGVAHNFNNMLMAIMPTMELLRRIVPASHVGLVDDAVGTAERAADMVRKLMTFAGQRRGPAPRPCDVTATARRVVDMCGRTFARHVTLRGPDTSDAMCVMADAVDLEQLIMNLVLNARDAIADAQRDQGLIEVQLTREHDGTAGAQVLLRVRDNGAGMSDHVKQHLFEPFFTSKGLGRGTGLGLATSYAVVRDLGGRIDVESELGVGTTISVWLPPCRTSSSTTGPERPVAPRSAVRVLVIDDEPHIRQVLTQLLEEFGCKVRSAGDGKTALAEVEREAPDVMLLDRSMPDALGFALLPALRARAGAAKIAYFTGQEVPPSERAAVDAVIQKPIRGADLMRVICELAGIWS